MSEAERLGSDELNALCAEMRARLSTVLKGKTKPRLVHDLAHAVLPVVMTALDQRDAEVERLKADQLSEASTARQNILRWLAVEAERDRLKAAVAVIRENHVEGCILGVEEGCVTCMALAGLDAHTEPSPS